MHNQITRTDAQGEEATIDAFAGIAFADRAIAEREFERAMTYIVDARRALRYAERRLRESNALRNNIVPLPTRKRSGHQLAA